MVYQLRFFLNITINGFVVWRYSVCHLIIFNFYVDCGVWVTCNLWVTLFCNAKAMVFYINDVHSYE